MTETQAAHSHPWKISDVVIFPGLAAGGLAEWLWPTLPGLSVWTMVPLGLLLALGGFGLITWSKRQLDAALQPSLPGEPTTTLVTTGPFARSRNPNYLGAVIALFGGAVMAGSLWMLGTAVVTAIILDRWMIRPEERYLADRFGEDYRRYRDRVRRWI